MTSTKWLNCRLIDVQQQLAVQGHVVSRPVIGRLLKAHDYRLRANRKELTGARNHRTATPNLSTSLHSASSMWRLANP